MKRISANTPVRKISLIIMLILSDALFFLLNDPYKLPATLMLLGFVLCGLSVYLLCKIGARVIKAIGFIKEERHLVIVATSALVTMVLILQALGQLSFRDIVALLALTAVAYFYFTRVSPQKLQS